MSLIHCYHKLCLSLHWLGAHTLRLAIALCLVHDLNYIRRNIRWLLAVREHRLTHAQWAALAIYRLSHWTLALVWTVMWLVNDRLPPLVRLALHDYIHLEQLEPNFFLGLLAVTLASAYMAYVELNGFDGHWFDVVGQLFLTTHNDLFRWPCFVEASGSASRTEWMRHRRGRKLPKTRVNVQAHVQRLAVAISNTFNMLNLVIVAYWAVCEWRIQVALQHHRMWMPLHSDWQSAAVWLFLFGQGLALLIGLLCFARSFVIIATFGMTGVYVIRLKMVENVRLIRVGVLLQHRRKRKEIDRRFGDFLGEHVRLCRLLNAGNRLLGPAFFAFLVVSAPVSSYLGMMVAFSGVGGRPRMHRLLVVLCLLVVILTNGVIFALHLYLCRLPAVMHRPARLLLPLFAKVCVRWTNLPARLRVALYVQHWHTTNRYTITYGALGKIDYRSFRLCVSQYWKLMVFAYVLVK